MTTYYAVFRADGALVSTGSVIADPLGAGLSARALTTQEQAWLAAGGAWDSAARAVREPAPAVPDAITPWQMFTWLWREHRITEAQVDAVIDTIPVAAVREQTRIDVRKAPYVLRTHAMLPALAAALGIADLDAAFVGASRLG